ncbi:MAG: apolipoprotein N-acyltransferase [Spirochaetota bacterium]
MPFRHFRLRGSSTLLLRIYRSHGWLLLSLLSALLLILTFPEPGIEWLGWIALAPLFLVVQRERISRVLFAGLVSGVLFNLVYISWMKEYKHPAALSGGVFGELVFFMGAVLLCTALVRGNRGPRSRVLRPLLLTAGWMCVDYLKTVGFLGFPWGILGYALYENTALIQNASLFGVWGVDFLMLYANAAVAGVLDPVPAGGPAGEPESPSTRPPAGIGGGGAGSRGAALRLLHPFLALFLTAGALAYGYGQLQREPAGVETTRVALVQGNFDPWSPRLGENLSTQFTLTRRALRRDPDLVVWSESSVPFFYRPSLRRNDPYALLVDRFIRDAGVPLVFGSLDRERAGGPEAGDRRHAGGSPESGAALYNVAVYYREGRIQGVYRKIRLVPFGEWFPYERLFPFVKTILERAGAGDFTPGEEYTLFQGEGYLFNVLICYEDVFGSLARQFVRRGSSLLVNITNDAWTGSRKAEIQHYAKSVFRAVENRRSLVRAANGGVTACVDPYGRPLGMLEPFTEDFLVCDVPVYRNRTTLYTRTGDAAAWAAVFCSVALLARTFLLWVLRKRAPG